MTAAGTIPAEVDVSLGCSYPLPFAASTQSGALDTAVPTDVTGWSFRETTGAAPADVQLMDGSQNTGLVIAEITLSPGQSIRDHTGCKPVRALRGIWVQVNSGSVRGTVWAGEP